MTMIYLRGAAGSRASNISRNLTVTDFQAAMGERAFPHKSRSLREHNHFAFDDLIFGKKIRTGFRIYRDFRVRKAFLDHSESLGLVGDGDKDEFLAQCTTGASARPHGADLPTFYHSLRMTWIFARVHIRLGNRCLLFHVRLARASLSMSDTIAIEPEVSRL
jgi:hypothetical protein